MVLDFLCIYSIDESRDGCHYLAIKRLRKVIRNIKLVITIKRR